MIDLLINNTFKHVGYQVFFNDRISFSHSLKIVGCVDCDMAYPIIEGKIRCNGRSITKCLCKG